MLDVEKTAIESVEYDEDEQAVIACVRPARRGGRRCGICQRRSPGYDREEGRRRWRSLDMGTVPVWIEAEAPRVTCKHHGPTIAAVPWTRHRRRPRFRTAGLGRTRQRPGPARLPQYCLQDVEDRATSASSLRPASCAAYGPARTLSAHQRTCDRREAGAAARGTAPTRSPSSSTCRRSGPGDHDESTTRTTSDPGGPFSVYAPDHDSP